MYPSRGSNSYGQQQQQQQPPPYSAQSAYGKSLGPAYSGGGPEGVSLQSTASRHSSMLGGPQETDIGGYRAHSSVGTHYGGQYSSVYGSNALTTSQQAAPTSGKGSGPSALESRGGYGSARQESPKFPSGDYVSSSSHGYGQKADQLFNDKISDYPSMDRRSGSYLGRDLPIEPTGRYSDSIGFAHQHQPDMYERIDQAAMLRQEQMLKAQSLQSASFDGGSRQADYHAARGAALRHPAQDLASYGGRMDADPHSLSMLSGSTYGAPQPPSILGAAPRRNVDDIVYAQSSSNPGYGVSLPPGRDYATGKGLHGASLELDFPGGLLPRGSHQMIDDRKDDRGGYAKEFERREEERRRDHLREREKDREREKERERERDRERERKRERSLERRKKDKDRESKRGSEVRREPTPPRASKDRRGASLSKDGRSARRESPRHEASHRRRSPVKEKRRDYVCKVYSYSFTEVERDYLSIDKRYPRLFISPECSKVVVNWPREDLKLPFRTPVSFEHDFVEEEAAAEQKLLPTKLLPTNLLPTKSSSTKLSAEPVKLESGTSVWNAKMILMSGLSQNALDELSSERSYDDRIPHFCNMLRFAVLKNGGSFMAIGGPWDTVDAGDPSIDDVSLVHTVTRYAKDATELDLKNCHNWNRFLEIHYDRVGKDGLFSHKEVTVLYVPDLSECLPSLDTWRDQWFAHKKAVAERENQYALKKEKSREKKEGLKVKDKEPDSKDLKKDDKSEKKKETESSGQALNTNKKENNGNKSKEHAAEKEGNENGKKLEKKDGLETSVGGDNSEKKEQGDSASIQTAGEVKPGKKKIIKKVIKQKVAVKKDGEENSTKQNEKVDEKDVTGQQDEPAASPAAVKTFTRKKVAKKVQVGKTAQKEDEGVQQDVKSVKESEGSEDKKKGKSDSSNVAVVQDATGKKNVKKKIIKRVPKKKAAAVETNEGVTDGIRDGDKDEKKADQGGKNADPDTQGSEEKSEKKELPKTKSKSVTSEKQDDADNSSKIGNKDGSEHQKEEKSNEKSGVSGSKAKAEDDKSQKDGHNDKREKSKDDKERKDKDGKGESRSKSNREVKDKKKPEEPPRHPGVFLRTKGSKDSKLRSLSLSLDSLLDYTDKDIEESTFELSLFAETLYEMLQFQMGCRLLAFLEKLRIKFVTKRNQKKRQREDTSEKESAKKPSTKRVKTEEAAVKNKSIKTETQNEADIDIGKNIIKEDNTTTDEVAKSKPNGETDEDEKLKPDGETDGDEDPEEDPEEDEEMADASPQHESNEENADVEADVKSEKVDGNKKDEQQETAKDTSNTKSKLDAEGKAVVETATEISDTKIPKLDAESKEAATKKKEKKETPVIIDKDLLQAFRFFDRNRAGYIRVEDMRLIIHNLGKFMSHRDVKELVQSALIESNTGRDDRILYNKLVRMSGL